MNNIQKTKDKIAIMMQYTVGEQIQVKLKGDTEWEDLDDPSWAWNIFEYRVKPLGN